MQINVRLSSGLSKYVGSTRLRVTVPEDCTLAVLQKKLRQDYPPLSEPIRSAVAIIAGRHAAFEESLSPGQEVAFLIPISGGSQ